MLIVHHLGVSQSDRIPWLCEELEIPYALKLYVREESGLAPPDYKALHPTGTAPVIEDDGIVLAESGAVVQFILAKYGGGRLQPQVEQPEFADYLFWLHFANASFMPARLVIVAGHEAGEDNILVNTFRKRDAQNYVMVEARLAAVPYLAGEAFTAADIMMAFLFTTARRFAPRDLSAYPAIRAWLARLGDRPAYRRAMAKADPGKVPLLD